MEKTLSTLLIILGFLVGVAIGAVIIPQEVKTITVEKPVEVIKTVNNTVEVPVEVYKDHLSDATMLFLKELEDDDELLFCDGHEYDIEDVELSKVYDKYSVTFDDEDKTVDFTAKLRYKESDLESCTNNFDVTVFYEEDEKPVVNY